MHSTDAVNKKYLEQELQKICQAQSGKNLYVLDQNGLVPHLTSADDETGYSASASSDKDINHVACKAFNQLRSTEWRVSGDVTENFWIELHCPEPVRVYKVTLAAAEGTKLISWKLQGANDSSPSWTDLPFDTRPVESFMRSFKIDPILTKDYQLYKIIVEKSEGKNPGLRYFQLFTVSPVLIL